MMQNKATKGHSGLPVWVETKKATHDFLLAINTFYLPLFARQIIQDCWWIFTVNKKAACLNYTLLMMKLLFGRPVMALDALQE